VQIRFSLSYLLSIVVPNKFLPPTSLLLTFVFFPPPQAAPGGGEEGKASEERQFVANRHQRNPQGKNKRAHPIPGDASCEWHRQDLCR